MAQCFCWPFWEYRPTFEWRVLIELTIDAFLSGEMSICVCRHFQVNSQLNSLCPWKYPFLKVCESESNQSNVFLELILSKILRLKNLLPNDPCPQNTTTEVTLTDLFKIILELTFESIWVAFLLQLVNRYLTYDLENSSFCCFFLDLIFKSF